MKHLEESFLKFQNAETANMNLFFHQANFWFILTESLKHNLVSSERMIPLTIWAIEKNFFSTTKNPIKYTKSLSTTSNLFVNLSISFNMRHTNHVDTCRYWVQLLRKNTTVWPFEILGYFQIPRSGKRSPWNISS
jgi:hypothetical protein